jgi:hypothetical protein
MSGMVLRALWSALAYTRAATSNRVTDLMLCVCEVHVVGCRAVRACFGFAANRFVFGADVRGLQRACAVMTADFDCPCDCCRRDSVFVVVHGGATRNWIDRDHRDAVEPCQLLLNAMRSERGQ